MKSEHRHELKTNELADWLKHFPQWLKTNTRTIIYVAVVLVLAISSYLWRNYQVNVVQVAEREHFTEILSALPKSKMQILQSQSQGYDTSINLLQAADQLSAIANKTKNKPMAALAHIKRADILRMELHYRFGEVANQDITVPIDKAMASYTKALKLLSADDLEANPDKVKSMPLAAAATLGLALCQEEKGNFPEAQKLYRQLNENIIFAGTTAAVTAARRLEVIADYQQKVAFEPAKPKPLQNLLMQPAIELNLPELAAPETNLPN